MIILVILQEDPNIDNSKQAKKISPTHRQSDQLAQDCVKVANLINPDKEKVDQEKTVHVTEATKAPVTNQTEPIIAAEMANFEDSSKEMSNIKAIVPETTNLQPTNTTNPTINNTNPITITTIPTTTQSLL